MRIGEPEVVVTPEAVTLQARVALAPSGDHRAYPDRLWFRLPSRFAPIVSRGAEPFVVALSSLASRRNEAIDIQTPISERLAVGLEEYWAIMSAWASDKFNPIVLNCTAYAPAASPPADAATAFSGGVDSFYTLYRGVSFGPDRPPTHRIRYAMFVHGFDIPLSERNTYAAAASAYEDELRKVGVELVRIETNLKEFIPAQCWEMGHGTALGGAALAIAGGVGRFFIPSSKSYTTLDPWGSHPLVDGLMSTDAFQFIHDGARATRFDKLDALQHCASTRRLLRTCYARPEAHGNCGHCHKCRRTMMMLAALGILDEFETYPAIKSPMHFIKCKWVSPHERQYARQTIAYARANGRNGLAWIGRIALVTSRLKQLGTILKVRSRPIRYRLKAAVRQPWGRGGTSVTKKQQA